MKILVTGGRDFRDIRFLEKSLNSLGVEITCIVHGEAKGADFLASVIAIAWGIEEKRYPANWNEHGKAAGHMRNTQMLQEVPDIVVAMPGGRGTEDMVQQSLRHGFRVVDFRKGEFGE